MQTELIELGVAIVALGLIMVGLRKAATRSRERGPDSIKERLGVEEPKPEKRKPEAKKPEPKAEKKPEP